jgi:hypothetical protein
MADPTTDEVRDAYVDRKDFEDQVARVDRRGDATAEAEFDRWLAQHDRQVAAKALRDAAGALVDANPGGDAFQHAVAYRVARGLYQRAEEMR